VAYPIFEALKKGEKFPVSLLLNERDSVRLYWDWWWQQADMGKLTRPYSVLDDDPWLLPTVGKATIDTETHREYLSDFAIFLQDNGILRRGCSVPRPLYRTDLIGHLAKKATKSESPTIVFTGGGYGAGKTTATDVIVRSRKLPIDMGSIMGVDYFKLYLTEFRLLQMLAEGRASTIVQEESRSMSNELFGLLIENRLSFGWDSSMSDPVETIPKLKSAKSLGYRTILVGVFAPIEIAVRQAMLRAKQSRRFAHPEFLPKSHIGFQKSLKEYLPYFDDVLLFENEGIMDANGNPNFHFLAEKSASIPELAIHNNERFSNYEVK
jgi:Zeta toxin